MSRVKDLLDEVETRFAKVVRDVTGDLPVTELSDGELVTEVAKNVPAPFADEVPAPPEA